MVAYLLPMKDTPLELDFRNSDRPIRPKVTGQRHVTWADLHEHPANTPSMTEVFEPVHNKRSGIAPANLEGRSDQALISTSTSTQVEQLPDGGTIAMEDETQSHSRVVTADTTSEEGSLREPINGEVGQTRTAE